MIRIYENDGDMQKNRTVVTACRTLEDGTVQLQLEESIFFPEGGGQYADRGWLQAGDQRIALTNGLEKGGETWYTVDRALEAGTEVECTLDWGLRFDRMQQHTGEHIMTGVIHNKYGFDNVGFHLSDDSPVTLDLNGELSMEQVMEMEAEANAVVFGNLPVNISYPSKAELAALEYRSKIEIEGQVRIVTIGDPADPVDVCACCAPHLSHTGEVGLIKVITAQRYKGGIRIGILCGRRALAHYDQEWSRMNQIARFLSTGPENVLNTIQQQRQEIADLRHEISVGVEKRLMAQIEAMPQAANLLLITSDELTPAAFKNGFNALAARCPGYAGLFMGTDEAGYRFYAGSTTLDSRELAGKMRAALQSKGGGSREMIQGKVSATRAQLEEFFSTL